MATGLRLVTERDGAGRPVLDVGNGEELMHVLQGVSIVLGDGHRPPESPGTLYITTKQVVWLSDTDRAKGYAVDFISVSLHAVSSDPEVYPSPCIYTQIETGAEEDEMEDSGSENDDAVDISKITEIRLVPSDPNQLDVLFAIFCECAELNPDPTEAEEEVEHNWIFSADQLENDGEEDDGPECDVPEISVNAIGANGTHDLAHSVVQLHINDQRFEDAEEMEQENKNGHH
ncbi:nucleotide-sensitive chloride conductance regulator family protein [Striga asiatica]|uniref:Nucleotide-sensitive chloride conductance regulator family protein n=1 Tax=Striga asiatica TaxID=4170 RepID=A0A5A7QSL4_STRAF|nr:nucleotide-sensitive chloride conductance regulator family protein [Striga asiatica]